MSYHRDLLSEMSHSISTVIKSYESRMTFFNHQNVCFYFIIVKLFTEKQFHF